MQNSRPEKDTAANLTIFYTHRKFHFCGGAGGVQNVNVELGISTMKVFRSWISSSKYWAGVGRVDSVSLNPSFNSPEVDRYAPIAFISDRHRPTRKSSIPSNTGAIRIA